MIELRVGNSLISGWTSARVPFGIEQISNSFNIKATYKGITNVFDDLRLGQSCQVYLEGTKIITGNIDDIIPAFDATSRSMTIEGRDATGDLVDCSAIHKSGQWKNATLDKIVRDLCQPFGIAVSFAASPGAAFTTFSIQEGETVFECLDRACRMRAFMPVSDSNGGLLVTRAKSGKPIASLIEGENIYKADGQFSMRERYSHYHIKGQTHGSDDNILAPERHTQVSAKVTDNAITRYRPLVLLAEDTGSHATYGQRIQWERNVRRGRSARGAITVRGWHNKTGALWQANTIADIDCPTLKADGEVLIAGGNYIIDEEQGYLTELSIINRDAFELSATGNAQQWSGFAI